MSAHTAALAAVLAVAVIAARALFLWLRALVRKARIFAWGAAFGATAAASAHLGAAPAFAAVAVAAAAAVVVVAAVRVLARSAVTWGAA